MTEQNVMQRLRLAGVPFTRWGTATDADLTVEFANFTDFMQAVRVTAQLFKETDVPVNRILVTNLIDAVENDLGWEFMQDSDNRSMVNDAKQMVQETQG